jgi:hypothetical protein
MSFKQWGNYKVPYYCVITVSLAFLKTYRRYIVLAKLVNITVIIVAPAAPIKPHSVIIIIFNTVFIALDDVAIIRLKINFLCVTSRFPEIIRKVPEIA